MEYMMNKKDITESLKHLKGISKDILSNYNFSEILISLHQECFDKIQSYKPVVLATIYEQIRNTKGIEELETCRKIVILECLLNSWNDMFSDKYPLSIQSQFKKNSERIFNMCQSEQGWSEYSGNVYWKDLAVTRQQMFPVGGGRLIEAFSGFGFRQGLSTNPLQLFKFFKMLLYTGGNIGYYQIHLHTPFLSDFNEQGMHDCYISTAEMLMKQGNIKGVFSSSWLYDPQLGNVSPILMYLQKIWLQNGAASFYVGVDQSKNAFVKSKTRLKLYEQGKYQPKIYLVVWPRKAMIKWARTCIGENM
jgi:hypothetical protein